LWKVLYIGAKTVKALNKWSLKHFLSMQSFQAFQQIFRTEREKQTEKSNFYNYKMEIQHQCRSSKITYLSHTAKTKYRKFKTNIPRKGISGSQSQFPHSCVCERFIYSHNWSASSAGGTMWTNPGTTVYRSLKDT